jgi:CheY-like chemotaxis protein
VTARIAVIDDEAPNRAYVQTMLGTAGFEVQAAAGGNEGVALVEKERPDLVIVDLMMPEVDGYMVCERIRKGPAGADVQIVVHGSLQLSFTEVAAMLKMDVAAMILYQRDEFSAASKRRMPIVIHHPQAQATAQFAELMQALVAV